jgi:hypothetical protein
MAVDLDAPSQPNGKSSSFRFHWKDILSAAAPVIALGGLVIYGLQSMAYDQFYSSVGTTPADVGLGYSAILAGSVGIILVIVPVSVGIAGVLALLRYHPAGGLFVASTFILFSLLGATQNGAVYWFIACVGGILPLFIYTRILARAGRSLSDLVPHVRRSFPRDALVAISITLILLGIAGLRDADRASDAMSQNRPIVPQRIGPLTLLAFRASPAVVRPVSNPSGISSMQVLDKRSFFYLGQADGVAVLIERSTGKITRIPSSSVLLDIANCSRSGILDTACKNVYTYRYEFPHLRLHWFR